MTHTYKSRTQLNLGHVPQIDDPVLYEELLDIHDALEKILISTDVDRQRDTDAPSIIADYTIQASDGMVRIDGTAAALIEITLPPVSEVLGMSFILKRIDGASGNAVTIEGQPTELIDNLTTKGLGARAAITIRAHSTQWDIVSEYKIT